MIVDSVSKTEAFVNQESVDWPLNGAAKRIEDLPLLDLSIHLGAKVVVDHLKSGRRVNATKQGNEIVGDHPMDCNPVARRSGVL